MASSLVFSLSGVSPEACERQRLGMTRVQGARLGADPGVTLGEDGAVLFMS